MVPTASGRVAQLQFEMAATLPLVRGRRERSERGGRSHTIRNLRLGNRPVSRSKVSGKTQPRPPSQARLHSASSTFPITALD